MIQVFELLVIAAAGNFFRFGGQMKQLWKNL